MGFKKEGGKYLASIKFVKRDACSIKHKHSVLLFLIKDARQGKW